MTSPRLSNTTSKGRTYSFKDREVPSVTSIIGAGVPKPALVNWGPRVCGEWVSNNMSTLQAVEDKKLIIDMVKGAPWRDRDAAADMGTMLHQYAEALTSGLPVPEVPDKLVGFIKHLELFLQEWKPDFTRTEVTVFNFKYGYAGTLDFLAGVSGHGLVLGDYKTSKFGRQGHGIYPETCLQLNAYANAEFMVDTNGVEIEMPPVDTLLAVNIRSDRYAVVPCEKSDRAFRAFLYAKQVSEFVKSGGEFVGEPLAPPIKAAS